MMCPHCAVEVPPGFAFCGNCGQRLDKDAPAPRPAPEASSTVAAAQAEASAERREIAILFADLSGFTAMCERLDPEEVHSVMNQCFEGLGRVIAEEDGHIDKYIGDNVMALFGAPIAHEDDAARACRAALGMQGFLQQFADKCERRTGARMQMRIGIHYGLVLAGGVGSAVRMDYSVMGDAVNLASRLESNAPPGGVLVSKEVARNSQGRFEFGPPRQVKVKGKVHPVEAYELLREVRDRRGRDGLSVPMIGRETQLNQLLRRWDAVHRDGHWIQITGEIGIGKTRLVEEAAAQAGKRLLVVTATPSDTRRPFGLAQRLVRGILGEVSGGTLLEIREDFDTALARLGSALEDFADVLWYLAAPTRLSVPAPDADPQAMRRLLERGVLSLVGAFAQHAPETSLFLDSYECVDEASHQLFESEAGSRRGWPLPVLIAARNRDQVPVDDDVLLVDRLGTDDASRLLTRLVRDAQIPESLRRDIVDRAAGVPLFLEEMVRTLIEQSAVVVGEGGWSWDARHSIEPITLPSSIRGAMVARLDQLDRPARDLLCECSVQGVEFNLQVAEIVRRAPARRGPLVTALIPDLERRMLVARHSLKLPSVRVFHQPLLQEACYEKLLLRDRRLLHGEIADALCERAGRPDGVAPELLALHCERAERWSQAAQGNVWAGDRASELCRNEEALDRYVRALNLLEHMDQGAPSERRMAFRAYRGMSQIHLRRGSYAVVAETTERMAAVCDRPEERAETNRLRALSCTHTGRTAEAQRLLQAALEWLRESPSETAVAVDVGLDLADLDHRAGRTSDALDRVRQCRALLDPTEDGLMLIRLDMLAGSIAHTEGRFSQAAALYERAYEEAQRAGGLSDRARAVNAMGNVARDTGRYEEAERHFSRALEIWERMGDVECIAGAQNNLGNLAMSRGDLGRARQHHLGSLAAARQIGNVHGTAIAYANLAILEIEAKHHPEAVTAAEHALAALGASENSVLRALALGVLGEAHLACGDVMAARAIFESIVDTCTKDAHPLALSTAHRGLGRILLQQGEVRAALGMLDQALAGFERLERAQETGRTLLYRAEAAWRSGNVEAARADAERARGLFQAMSARADLAEAERLSSRLGEVPP